ncbi:hypothetical protein R3P38DRAFT_3117697 [Favolaschia claudopus]|uniref:F-box domain-containing protein n=1 Tax=Favolaschia claudopus TaxID=2862362 RepID=A0AAV9ZE54_9AGAR
MVLTRSASRAKCIFKWLPNEILDLIASELSTADLAVVCRTSRLLRNIAMPLLYRCVKLSTRSGLMLFARSLLRSFEASLPNLVREFDVAHFMNKKATVYPGLVVHTNHTLCRMIHLESLTLLERSIDYTHLLEHGQFPELVVFQYLVPSHALPALTSFLNCHKNITDLGLISPCSLKFSTPLSLPKLQSIMGSFAFLSALDLTDVSLTHLTLLLYPPDICAAHAVLFNLHEMKMLSSVEVMGMDANEREILHVIAGCLPHMQELVFHHCTRTSSPISSNESVNIAASLETLGQLRSINFGAVGGNVIEDRLMVEQWSAACKSLISVTLDERQWDFKENNWVVSWNL